MSADVPLFDDRRAAVGLGAGVLSASEESILQLLTARHARSRLSIDALRDLKLASLLVELSGGYLSRGARLGTVGVGYDDACMRELALLGGLSVERLSVSITRLIEAGVLLIRGDERRQVVFADRALGPAGAREFVDWPSVLEKLYGQALCLLVVSSVLAEMQAPWHWRSLTHEVLAERSYYSVAMVRQGIARLVQLGVLERHVRAGRGHEYRCSQWALGRGPRAPVERRVPRDDSPSEGLGGEQWRVEGSEATAATQEAAMRVPNAGGSAAAEAALVVELGGLVLQVPPGTVIRMQRGEDGVVSYFVGPHLRLREPPPR